MKIKSIALYSICPALMLLLSCTGNPDLFIQRAGQEISDQFVKSMMESHRKESIQRIGIFAIENDTDHFQVRESLYNALIQYSDSDVVGMDEMKEKTKMLETLGNQLQYRRSYDGKTLVNIGKHIGQKCILIGRLDIIRQGLRSATVNFQGQVLDLEKGVLLYGKGLESTYYKPMDRREVGQHILIVAFLLLILIPVMSRLFLLDFFWDPAPEKVYRRYLMGGVIIFLILSALVSYYMILA